MDPDQKFEIEKKSYLDLRSDNSDMERRYDQVILKANTGGIVAVLGFASANFEHIHGHTPLALAIIIALIGFGVGIVMICVALEKSSQYYSVEARMAGQELGYEKVDVQLKRKPELLGQAENCQYVSFWAFVGSSILGLLILLSMLTAEADAGELTTIKPVDSDTFWHNGTKPRLAAVDTPEPTKCGNAECAYEAQLGDKASDFTKNIITTRKIEIEWSGKDDRYKRALVKVRVGDKYLGDMLIDAGLAKPWRGRQFDWCSAMPKGE